MAARPLLAAALFALAVPASAQAGFALQPSLSASADNSRAIAVGDLNNDGRQDLVVASADAPVQGLITTFLGDGAGGFIKPPGSPYPTASAPSDLALADVTANGMLDAVSSHDIPDDNAMSGQGVVSVHSGNGAGVLALAGGVFTAGDSASGLAVADLGGDGVWDFVVSNRTGIDGGLPGNLATVAGPLGMGSAFAGVGLPGALGPNDVTTGDFNGDGRLDLAAGSLGGVVVHLQGPGGAFSAAAGSPFDDGGTDPRAIEAADLNADGRLDLAIAARTSPGGVMVLLGNGSGGFAPAPGSPFATGANFTQGLAVADLTADGRPDLALANDQNPGLISVLRGDGAGGFTAVAGSPFAAAAEAVSDVAVADLDGDHQPDLVSSHGENAARVSVLLNTDDASVGLEALDFARRPVGRPVERNLVVRNPGSGLLRVANLALGGRDRSRFAVVGDGCTGVSVPSGGDCKLRLRFKAAKVGSHAATLSVISNAPGGRQVANLAGRGRPPLLGPVKARPRRFAVGRGTRFSFRLSEAARVRLRIQRPRRKRGSRRTRWTSAHIVLRRSGRAGKNRIRFSGRTRKRRLAPGPYRVRVVARDTRGNASAARVRRFRVLHRRSFRHEA